MTRLLSILIALITYSAASAQDYQLIADRTNSINHDIENTTLPSIIIAGDSLTQATQFSEICEYKVINGGISGVRTSTLLPLVEHLSQMHYTPAAIVIAVGINDTHKSLWLNGAHHDTFRHAYRAIVAAALTKTKNVLLANLSPVDFSQTIGSILDPNAYAAVNEEISKIAAEHSLRVIDASNLTINDGPLTFDGVHHSAAGRSAWVELIRSSIAASSICRSK